MRLLKVSTDIEKLICGSPLRDIVGEYEVNTVAMTGFTRFMNPMLDMRNELYGVRGVAETMIFKLNKGGQRTRTIVHCQRYRKLENAIKWHNKLVGRLRRGQLGFFNGNGLKQEKPEVYAPLPKRRW